MNRNDLQAYTHVTVIDGTDRPPLLDQTVVVHDGMIETIGPTAQVLVPESGEVIDLTGKFMIPGLADMHVHSESGTNHDGHFPALYIANGVTTVREMWGKPLLHEWRRRSDSGEIVGPRWVIASPLVDGAPALWSDIPSDSPILSVTTEKQARRAVAEIQDSGADFVKVYSRLGREAYFSVLDEARRRDMLVAGHRSDHVPFVEQVQSGQRSFEHVHGLWPATSSDVERFEAAMSRIEIEPEFYYASWFTQVNAIEWDAVHAYRADAAKSVFERLVENEVAYTPTLVMHAVVDLPESIRLDHEHLAYLTPDTPQMWTFVRDAVFNAGGRSAEEAAQRRFLFARRKAAVAAMSEAGVRILAGTDAMTPGLFPGFSLHDELAMLVESGLSPLQAIQAATIEPSRFLGRSAWSGTVQPNRAADLVVLDANPLIDIANTRRIHSVVSRGRCIDAEERRGLLDTARSIAQSHVPDLGQPTDSTEALA